MGFFRDLIFGPTPTAPSVLTPYTPQDSIQSMFVAESLGIDLTSPATLTRDTALQIPALKRAHDTVCAVLARMPWAQYDGDTRLEQQPTWLNNSASGVPPRSLRWGVASDLFMTGWAAVGFELGPDGYPIDALHVPQGWWGYDSQTGDVKVDERIAARYRDRVVLIPLGYGSNGILNDGRQTLVDARSIEAAYRDRIENPIVQTDLEVAAERWDMWTPEERRQFRDLYVANRRAKSGSTAVRPDWVKPTFSGQLPTDLFESGRNANRLDIANHAGLPASLLEGVRQGGSGGGTEIRYSGVQGGNLRNELWDFGLAKYADAIDARMSLDDICQPGQSIRVESGDFLTTPNPIAPLTSED